MRSTFRLYTWRRNVSGTSCKLPEEEFWTYQERLASYLKKMLQRISFRNSWHVTWRRVLNVPGTSCMLLEEDMTTHQEHLASYLKKMLHVAGTSCMLLEEDMTTYQERLASHLTKMLRRSRNVLPVCAQEHERYYPPHPTAPHRQLIMKEQRSACVCRTASCCAFVCTGTWTLFPHPSPPHPTPPVTDHERAVQCLCLQDSKKMMRLLCLTPCPSSVSPSVTLKVSFSGALQWNAKVVPKIWKSS